MRNNWQYWQRILIAFAACYAMLLLVGCGGGASSGAAGSVSLRIHWPTADSRELPAATRGMFLSITFPGTDLPAVTRWVERPVGESVTTITFFGLPFLDALLTLDAYDSAADTPRGTLIATAYARFSVRAGAVTSVSLILLPTTLRSLRCVVGRTVGGARHLVSLQPTGDAPVDLTPQAAGDYSDPALSSTGRWLAAVQDGRLGIIDMAAQVDVPFAAPNGGIASPAWAPGDDRLAYIRQGGVYLLPSSRAATPQRVTGVTDAPVQVAWGGPRHLLVVTTSTSQDTLLRVPLTPRDGTVAMLAVSAPGLLRAPCWNPTTNTLAFLRGGRLVIDGEFIPLEGAISAIAWTPDGGRLALCWTPPGGVSGLYLFKRGESPALVLGPEAGIDAVTIAANYTGVADVPVDITVD
jgi:hypothetical protein